MGIIMDLFDGSVYPYEQVVPRSEAYRKLRREIADLSRELQKELNSEEYEKVEHYRDLLSDSFHLEGGPTLGKAFAWGWASWLNSTASPQNVRQTERMIFAGNKEK